MGFGKYYGFTKEEIYDQLVDHSFKQKEYKEGIMNALMEWYNGYANSNLKSSFSTYNAYSVI